jgi:putative endonuclease
MIYKYKAAVFVVKYRSIGYMKYVYIIQNINTPDEFYTGIIDDISARLTVHNEGKSIYTNKFKPWCLMYYFFFTEEKKAFVFEQYLKSCLRSGLLSKTFPLTTTFYFHSFLKTVIIKQSIVK